MGAQLPTAGLLPSGKKTSPQCELAKGPAAAASRSPYSGDQERSVHVSLWMMLPSLYDQVIVS